jgi:hypothetical protein
MRSAVRRGAFLTMAYFGAAWCFGLMARYGQGGRVGAEITQALVQACQ